MGRVQTSAPFSHPGLAGPSPARAPFSPDYPQPFWFLNLSCSQAPPHGLPHLSGPRPFWRPPHAPDRLPSPTFVSSGYWWKVARTPPPQGAAPPAQPSDLRRGQNRGRKERPGLSLSAGEMSTDNVVSHPLSQAVSQFPCTDAVGLFIFTQPHTPQDGVGSGRDSYSRSPLRNSPAPPAHLQKKPRPTVSARPAPSPPLPRLLPLPPSLALASTPTGLLHVSHEAQSCPRALSRAALSCLGVIFLQYMHGSLKPLHK